MMRVIKVFSDEEFCLEASVVHARSQAPAWERTVSEAPASGPPAMIQSVGRQSLQFRRLPGGAWEPGANRAIFSLVRFANVVSAFEPHFGQQSRNFGRP